MNIFYSAEELLALFPASERTRAAAGGGGQRAPSVEAVRGLLEGVLKNRWDGMAPGFRDRWISMGMAIKGALPDNEEEAFSLWVAWSGPDERDDLAHRWEGLNPSGIGWGWLEIEAKTAGGAVMAAAVFDDGMTPPAEGEIGMDDFWAHATSGRFIYVRNGDLWPADSVNARCPPTVTVGGGGKMKVIPASTVLKQTRQVHQISWIPGQGMIVENMIVDGSGVRPCYGNRIYNSYRGPREPDVTGDPMKTLPWTAHARKLYPDDWEHILDWFAHRVQFPGVKVNHALVLGGSQGIGKDTLLEPLVQAIGGQNFQEVRPAQLMERFNMYRRSVVLRVSEAHDLGEGQNRVKFYNNMKTLITAPPEVLMVEQKGLDPYPIPNVTGVVITTNYKVDGLYLPEDDRRHYVAWSNKTESDFGARHFDGLWKWFQAGGYAHCRAFLAARDLSRFDPKAPPVKTRAFWTIAKATEGMTGMDAEDIIGALGAPEVFSWDEYLNKAQGAVHDMVKSNPRLVAAQIDAAGYEKVVNPANKAGKWRVNSRWATVYANKERSVPDQRKLAEEWARKKAISEKK